MFYSFKVPKRDVDPTNITLVINYVVIHTQAVVNVGDAVTVNITDPGIVTEENATAVSVINSVL